MITFDEALHIVTSNLPLNPTEVVSLHQCHNRVLAFDIASDMDMPPFDKSAVDGYACRRADLGNPLQLIEIVAAGQMPAKSVTEGCCIKVMTGAPIPEGADCVVMVEQTTMVGNETVHITNTKTKANIAHKAEDIRKGDVVLQKGTLLKPQHIAVLASVGASQPEVYTRVSLCILSTGDELVEPESVPGPGQIRNSNAAQLVTQAQGLGANTSYGGIVLDTEQDCRVKIGEALAKNQVVVLSGGISMGDFDYVPTILKELGFKILFKSIAVQPGRPTVFARSADKFVFALPGNPVSSFNIFELLAKPFLYRLMGHAFEPPRLRLPLAEDFSRRSPGRHGFVPAQINKNGEVEPIRYHGSAHINALVVANALFAVPMHIENIKKGNLVDVRLI
jgi:molybdopterin molybdotransferase